MYIKNLKSLLEQKGIYEWDSTKLHVVLGLTKGA
jgi:hypothetical protein